MALFERKRIDNLRASINKTLAAIRGCSASMRASPARVSTTKSQSVSVMQEEKRGLWSSNGISPVTLPMLVYTMRNDAGELRQHIVAILALVQGLQASSSEQSSKNGPSTSNSSRLNG